MTERLHLIALRTTRYSDRNAILSAYSLERGAVSLLLADGAGRQAVRMRALTMPLSLLECDVDVRPGRSIHNLRNPRPLEALARMRSHPIKNAVAQFVAEVLGSVLREGQPDTGMFRFIEASIRELDAMAGRSVANFHLCFLYGLARVAGIAPDVMSWREGSYFDMTAGTFRLTPPLHPHYLTADESHVLRVLDRLSYRTMHLWRLNHEQRNRVLDLELRYFSLHYSSLENLKSVAVLRSLF